MKITHHHILAMRWGREMRAFITKQEPSSVILERALLIIRTESHGERVMLRHMVPKDRYDLLGFTSTPTGDSVKEIEEWLLAKDPQEARQEAQEGGERERAVGEPRFTHGSAGFSALPAMDALSSTMAPTRTVVDAIFNTMPWDQQARVLEQLGWRRA